MRVSSMRIDSAARFVLQRQVHFVRSTGRDHVALENRSVVGDHRLVLVAGFHVDRHAIEVPATEFSSEHEERRRHVVVPVRGDRVALPDSEHLVTEDDVIHG